MDDRAKNKAFNRALSPFHAGKVPELGGDNDLRGHCVEVLKSEREAILASITEPEDDSYDSKTRYEEAVRQQMIRIVLRERRKWKRQANRECARQNRAKIKFHHELEVLRVAVNAGETPWRTLKMTAEWGGAGVIITANSKRPRGESDFFVQMADPRPVVWLLVTLRDADDELSHWMRDHAVYEKIARVAAEIWERHSGSPPNERELLNEVIDRMSGFWEQT